MRPRIQVYRDGDGWAYRIYADWPSDEETGFATEGEARAAAQAHIEHMEETV